MVILLLLLLLLPARQPCWQSRCYLQLCLSAQKNGKLLIRHRCVSQLEYLLCGPDFDAVSHGNASYLVTSRIKLGTFGLYRRPLVIGSYFSSFFCCGVRNGSIQFCAPCDAVIIIITIIIIICVVYRCSVSSWNSSANLLQPSLSKVSLAKNVCILKSVIDGARYSDLTFVTSCPIASNNCIRIITRSSANAEGSCEHIVS